MSRKQFLVTISSDASITPTPLSVESILTSSSSYTNNVNVNVEEFTTDEPLVKQSETPWKVRIDGYVTAQFTTLSDAVIWVNSIDKPKGVAIIHDTDMY